jgi:hypothetical protein
MNSASCPKVLVQKSVAIKKLQREFRMNLN